MMNRVGIFSGTFDPIHQGHIGFALEARRLCELDEVIFAAERNPRAKQGVMDIAHRTALIERAIQDTAGLRSLTLKSERFTVKNTLREIQSLFPGASLTLLIGSDVARTLLYRWEGLDVLLRQVTLVIGMRAGAVQAETVAIMDQLAKEYGLPITYRLVSVPHAHMASSDIRAGRAASAQLHPATLEYIEKYKLYT